MIYAIIKRSMLFTPTPSNASALTSIPLVVAVEMGYGHLRAAHNIAESLGTSITRMDMPPVAGPAEAALWRGILGIYTALSKACDSRLAGPAAHALLEQLTEITPLPRNNRIESANLLSHLADRLTGNFLGRRLCKMTAGSNKQVVATYPAAAMAVRRASASRVFCLATDTDLNRAWAARDPKSAGIEYFAPVSRVVDRLRTFGVPDSKIHLTGFPLPQSLVGQAAPILARRIHRLDPNRTFRSQVPEPIAGLIEQAEAKYPKKPIMLTLAVGGAGGQTRHVAQILQSLRKRILDEEVHLTLVAGIRPNVVEAFERVIQSVGLPGQGRGVDILFASAHSEYFQRFETCLAHTDILWTKPSELVFYAALGLPILLAPPVGGQEHANRQWLISNESALDAGDPSHMDSRLQQLLGGGQLCTIAWNAYSRLDRLGLDRILKILGTQ